MKAVIDTNILIDYLQGQQKAKKELALYEKPSISLVTWMELLVGCSEDEEPTIRSFLSRFDIQAINKTIAEHAIALRKKERIRLPNAIIWGTADSLGCILVTRNTKDFPADHPGVRVPYTI